MDTLRESSVIQHFTQSALAQGLEQGGQECAVADILDVLEVRFDRASAALFAAELAAIDDVQRLRQLLRAAVRVADLEEFRRRLEAAG